MARGLTRIAKLHGPIDADPNWQRAGTTPDGRQLYIERSRRSRAVPDYEDAVCDACEGSKKTKNGKSDCPKCDGTGMVVGKRRFAKNPLTAEPLYPKNKPEFYIQERMFYLDSDGQGNQYKIDWAPPTPEQIAADAHTRAVAEMLPKLAGALVDSGLSTDEIVERLTAPKALEPKGKAKLVQDDNPAADSLEL